MSWATLVQNVSLSIMLTTKDPLSLLHIFIPIAAIVNVICDALLCVYPFQLGCESTGAAISFAALFSSYFMICHLQKKKLLPTILPV
jgi:Na+-driven multidrug efflux pump